MATEERSTPKWIKGLGIIATIVGLLASVATLWQVFAPQSNPLASTPFNLTQYFNTTNNVTNYSKTPTETPPNSGNPSADQESLSQSNQPGTKSTEDRTAGSHASTEGNKLIVFTQNPSVADQIKSQFSDYAVEVISKSPSALEPNDLPANTSIFLYLDESANKTQPGFEAMLHERVKAGMVLIGNDSIRDFAQTTSYKALADSVPVTLTGHQGSRDSVVVAAGAGFPTKVVLPLALPDLNGASGTEILGALPTPDATVLAQNIAAADNVLPTMFYKKVENGSIGVCTFAFRKDWERYPDAMALLADFARYLDTL